MVSAIQDLWGVTTPGSIATEIAAVQEPRSRAAARYLDLDRRAAPKERCAPRAREASQGSALPKTLLRETLVVGGRIEIRRCRMPHS